MSKLYGYARVSTANQNLDEQLSELKAVGVDSQNIYAEKFTGTTTDRPEFQKLLQQLNANDILVVTKLDRFARNTREALAVIEPLLDQGTIIRVLNLGTIENTPMGKMIVRTLLSVAEMERDMIVERTQAGKEYAKKKNPNYREGRPRRQIGEHERAVYDYLKSHSANQTAQAFNISRSTVFRVKKQIELDELIR
ncbi:recombinase family protein [Latilactobacillus sakei]|uniref:recombinase family protein n=1 Tax=Latilactobacillus sakei TaxID=1599 RepID=UPI000FFC6330|nr:recombinase family protein [Latilactobacillus sakei]RXA79347.1 recombinase family protein [Latilactobacillus sakei]